MRIFAIALLLLACACQRAAIKVAPTQTQNMKQTNDPNPLLCDTAKGICEMPNSVQSNPTLTPSAPIQKPVRILYFTDPICSACWGIEPQLRRLKLEYGDAVEIEYRMGGLLPSWEVYNSGAISKPSDVAHHWDEVSAYYEMPIDGDVWLEDPLPSSYPPSVAFKAAQMQNETKALLFMRRVREQVFIEKKNICKIEHLLSAAKSVGLDTAQFLTDIAGKAQTLFQADLEFARKTGVRGFPTLILLDSAQKQQVLYGVRPYKDFETAVLKLAPQAAKKAFATDWESLFGLFPTLTNKEYEVLSGQSKQTASVLLENLHKQQKISALKTKNGTLWVKK